MDSQTEQLVKQLDKSSSKQERLKVLLDLVTIYKEQDYLQGWKTANEAVSLAKALDDEPSLANAYQSLATCAWKLADYTMGLEHFVDALEVYSRIGDKYGVAKCYCGMGIINGSLEEYKTALEYFEIALENSLAAKRFELSATLKGNIGHVYFNFGQYQKALGFFKEALAQSEESGYNGVAANMLAGIAGVHVYLGDYAKGLKMVRRAYELHKKVNRDHGTAVSIMNIGITLHKMGKLEEAEYELRKALEFSRSINLKTIEQQVISELVSLYTDLDNQEQAQIFMELHQEVMREEKKLSVQRKNEQLKQRAELVSIKTKG